MEIALNRNRSKSASGGFSDNRHRQKNPRVRPKPSTRRRPDISTAAGSPLPAAGSQHDASRPVFQMLGIHFQKRIRNMKIPHIHWKLSNSLFFTAGDVP